MEDKCSTLGAYSNDSQTQQTKPQVLTYGCIPLLTPQGLKLLPPRHAVTASYDIRRHQRCNIMEMLRSRTQYHHWLGVMTHLVVSQTNPTYTTKEIRYLQPDSNIIRMQESFQENKQGKHTNPEGIFNLVICKSFKNRLKRQRFITNQRTTQFDRSIGRAIIEVNESDGNSLYNNHSCQSLRRHPITRKGIR